MFTKKQMESIKLGIAVPIVDREEDDPQYLVVVHRDVGGPTMPGIVPHTTSGTRCWCNPLVLSPDSDPQREVFAQQLEGLGRLN